MQNEIKIRKDDIIEVIYRGDQTTETVTKMTENIIKYAKELSDQNKTVLILNSIKDMKSSSPGSRKAASDALKMDVYDKIAVFGGNVFFKYMAKLVMSATGRGNSVKYFDTKKEAVKWLKGFK